MNRWNYTEINLTENFFTEIYGTKINKWCKSSHIFSFNSAQLYGHIHQDKMKLQYLGDKYFDSADKTFILTGPSVTPVYGSNPAFRVYDYNPEQHVVVDYSQYHLDLPVSNGELFSRFHIPYSLQFPSASDICSLLLILVPLIFIPLWKYFLSSRLWFFISFQTEKIEPFSNHSLRF